ncbi:hypothetical protein GYB14_03785 [bacterium]|nr:hypothetical protein [bacterium]
MANRPVTITQNELSGYAKAMQAAGIYTFSITAERPDGTRLTIKAGSKEVDEQSRNIDAMLGINA